VHLEHATAHPNATTIANATTARRLLLLLPPLLLLECGEQEPESFLGAHHRLLHDVARRPLDHRIDGLSFRSRPFGIV